MVYRNRANLGRDPWVRALWGLAAGALADRAPVHCLPPYLGFPYPERPYRPGLHPM
jgi:hypothetical protein